jgi:hypothetical protein
MDDVEGFAGGLDSLALLIEGVAVVLPCTRGVEKALAFVARARPR